MESWLRKSVKNVREKLKLVPKIADYWVSENHAVKSVLSDRFKDLQNYCFKRLF